MSLSPPPTPAWVKLLAVLVALVALAFVVSAIAGVEHGPGRHGGSPEDGPPAAHTPPPGGHE